MSQLLDDASLPTDQGGLRDQIQILEERLAACETEIKTLMDQEDPAAGIEHSAAIHAAKQMMMMLRYQRTLRKVRLRQAPTN